MKRIQIIDSHTGGEPTRLVIDGFPELGKGSMMPSAAPCWPNSTTPGAPPRCWSRAATT
jgi:proline racemase